MPQVVAMKNSDIESVPIAAAYEIAISRVESILFSMLINFLCHEFGHLISASALELWIVATARAVDYSVADKTVGAVSARHSMLLKMNKVMFSVENSRFRISPHFVHLFVVVLKE